MWEAIAKKNQQETQSHTQWTQLIIINYLEKDKSLILAWFADLLLKHAIDKQNLVFGYFGGNKRYFEKQ